MKNIALVYDADNTLIDGYHPDIILKRRGIDIRDFWKKIEKAQGSQQGDGYLVGQDILYLSYFLHEVRHGKLSGLSICEIKDMGTDLEKMLFPGLPDFFENIKKENSDFYISHHVISTGIQHLLEGSVLASYMKSITGYTFLDNLTPGIQIDGIKSTCSSREKIPVLVGISYGKYANVNSAKKRFECPFTHMIYFGDQQTDRPVFRFLRKRKGITVCVYHGQGYTKARKLAQDVDFVVPADYRKGSKLWDIVMESIARM